MNTCNGCRFHYRERHWRIFKVDFCGRTGYVVGFECPIGCIETEGCPYYERRFVWHEGAIA